MGIENQSRTPIMVFVGGTGRSGTTIVADLLNNHPDVRSSLPIELKFTTNAGGLLDLTFGSQFAPTKENTPIPFYNIRTRRDRKIREVEKDRKALIALEAKINSTWWDIDAPPPHGRGLVSGSRSAEDALRHRQGEGRAPRHQRRNHFANPAHRRRRRIRRSAPSAA